MSASLLCSITIALVSGGRPESKASSALEVATIALSDTESWVDEPEWGHVTQSCKAVKEGKVGGLCKGTSKDGDACTKSAMAWTKYVEFMKDRTNTNCWLFQDAETVPASSPPGFSCLAAVLSSGESSAPSGGSESTCFFLKKGETAGQQNPVQVDTQTPKVVTNTDVQPPTNDKPATDQSAEDQSAKDKTQLLKEQRDKEKQAEDKEQSDKDLAKASNEPPKQKMVVTQQVAPAVTNASDDLSDDPFQPGPTAAQSKGRCFACSDLMVAWILVCFAYAVGM